MLFCVVQGKEGKNKIGKTGRKTKLLNIYLE